MALWYSNRPRVSSNNGKFATRRETLGDRAGHGTVYRDWEYHLVRHMTGATMRRPVYHVAIRTPQGVRIAYLPGHSNASDASRAAREWIDSRLGISG